MDELIQQAFDVELPDDFDPTGIPSDGYSYLQKVMYEANNCPDIVVAADLDNLEIANKSQKYAEDNFESLRTPAVMMLTLEDQLEEVAKFSMVRQKIARERAKNPDVTPQCFLPQDKKSWRKFCFGANSHQPDEDGVQEGALPLLSILMCLSQCEVLDLLDYHVEYLESKAEMSKQQAVWLYALLVFTELPLLPDTCSTLRNLARACSRIRVALDSVHDPQLPAVNLFICLVARYFHQADLGDDPSSADAVL